MRRPQSRAYWLHTDDNLNVLYPLQTWSVLVPLFSAVWDSSCDSLLRVFLMIELDFPSIVYQVVGAMLALVSLIEFVWYATIPSSEQVSDYTVCSEDTAYEPEPVDLMASIVQMMTFVSYRSVCHLASSFWITLCLSLIPLWLQATQSGLSESRPGGDILGW